MAEVIKSTKGKMKLSHDGYFYVKQYENPGKIRWVCDKKRSCRCNGAVLTDLANGNANVTSPHNNIRDQGQIDTAKKSEEMKALATSTIAGPSAIQSDVLLNANNEVKARIGTTEACSQAMARARKRSFPANPTDLDQLIIQDGFATTGG